MFSISGETATFAVHTSLQSSCLERSVLGQREVIKTGSRFVMSLSEPDKKKHFFFLKCYVNMGYECRVKCLIWKKKGGMSEATNVVAGMQSRSFEGDFHFV